MDKRAIIVLGIAVIAIGIFIIPSTMSMFMGQHQWFSVRTAESQYKMCERCHASEVSEWRANVARGGAHSSYENEGSSSEPGCFCHQVNESRLSMYGINTTNIEGYGFEIFNESGNLTGVGDWNSSWRTQDTPHAALTIACIDCHLNASSQLSNPKEAHGAFYNATLDLSGDDVSENTACLACHTMIGLNITMERNQGGIIIVANHTNYTSNGWELNISMNSSERTSNSTYWAPNQTD